MPVILLDLAATPSVRLGWIFLSCTEVFHGHVSSLITKMQTTGVKSSCRGLEGVDDGARIQQWGPLHVSPLPMVQGCENVKGVKCPLLCIELKLDSPASHQAVPHHSEPGPVCTPSHQGTLVCIAARGTVSFTSSQALHVCGTSDSANCHL